MLSYPLALGNPAYALLSTLAAYAELLPVSRVYIDWWFQLLSLFIRFASENGEDRIYILGA